MFHVTSTDSMLGSTSQYRWRWSRPTRWKKKGPGMFVHLFYISMKLLYQAKPSFYIFLMCCNVLILCFFFFSFQVMQRRAGFYSIFWHLFYWHFFFQTFLKLFWRKNKKATKKMKEKQKSKRKYSCFFEKKKRSIKQNKSNKK